MDRDEKIREAIEHISKMSPKHMEILLRVLDHPKRGIAALNLMIANAKGLEAKKRLMNLKHSLEDYALDVEAGVNEA